MAEIARAQNIEDLRKLAQRRLPRGIFEYIDRGTEDEVALRQNRAAFERIRLRPRMLVDVSRRSTAATVMGKTQAMPVIVAPTGAAGLVWFEGELAIAKAAAAADIPFTLATGSMTAMEKVAEQAGGRLWFQLYMWADRSLSHQLVARARSAGFGGLVVTVDTPTMANREYNSHNGFALPFNPSPRAMADMLLHPQWLAGVLLRYLRTSGMPTYENLPPEHRLKITKGGAASPLMRCDSLSWNDIRTLRELWPGTLIVKGILAPEDAVRAVACGVDAVVVSNHGGRNLDSALAPIDALADVVVAVAGRAKVIVDSGIRRGSDVLKARAIGAEAVMVGRAPLYGAAAGGAPGAARALEILRHELNITLAMTGCATMDDVGPALLVPHAEASAAVRLPLPGEHLMVDASDRAGAAFG